MPETQGFLMTGFEEERKDAVVIPHFPNSLWKQQNHKKISQHVLAAFYTSCLGMTVGIFAAQHSSLRTSQKHFPWGPANLILQPPLIDVVE